MSEARGTTTRPNRRVVIAANSVWNIINFRQPIIQAVQAAGAIPVMISPIEPGSQSQVRELGLEWLNLPIARSGLNPIADLRLLVSFGAMLRRLAPLALLSFTIKPNIYGCIAARLLGIPAIANISGLGTLFIKRSRVTRFAMHLYRFALSKAHIVFFHNPDDLALFVGQGLVRPDQARVLPGSGIDLDHFVATHLPAGRPKLLLIARLLEDKGVREFIEAARLLRREGSDLEFQLLGPIDIGNRTSISRAELDAWVAQGIVDYLGDTDDVRPFIAAASAVVLPSYREGLPRTLLEGAAMGRPLIATDVPGCREVVQEGVTGFLCEPRDSIALMQAMKKLAQLPLGERQKMGGAARGLVERRFGQELIFEAYCSALSALTEPKRR